MNRLTIFMIATVASFASVSVAHAASYESPDGYRFDQPDGWVMIHQLHETCVKDKADLYKGYFNVDPDSGDEGMSLDDVINGLIKSESIMDGYAFVGKGKTMVGSEPAAYVDYLTRDETAGLIEVRETIVFHNGAPYLLYAGAVKDAFTSVKPAFDGIEKSFRFTDPKPYVSDDGYTVTVPVEWIPEKDGSHTTFTCKRGPLKWSHMLVISQHLDDPNSTDNIYDKRQAISDSMAKHLTGYELIDQQMTTIGVENALQTRFTYMGDDGKRDVRSLMLVRNDTTLVTIEFSGYDTNKDADNDAFDKITASFTWASTGPSGQPASTN